MTPLRKHTRSSLVAVSDTYLEGVIVKPSNQGTSATLVLRFKNLKQELTICWTVFRSVHHTI
jgi:hypothetical protein